MSTPEILPKPQDIEPARGSEAGDSGREKDMSQRVERKQGPSHGSAAISGLTQDDASAGVSSAQFQGVGATPTTPSYASMGAPLVADDLDLIEKEWVNKAKEIVRITQGDAYQQNNQINQIKAEYIKKRYDKDVKVREEE